MAQETKMTQFYTYMWLREDGTPYYIGKGKGRRAFINVGHTVKRPVDKARILVQYWDSEEAAFELEKWYISLFGRKDIGTGILRNMTNGGDGPSGYIFTEEIKQRMRHPHKATERTEEHSKNISKATKECWSSKKYRDKVILGNLQAEKRQGTSSKFKGVSFNKGRGRDWVAYVSIGNGKVKHLGRFDTELEAALAAKAERDSAWQLQSLEDAGLSSVSM
jgi:hypothetical protein